MCHVCDSVKDFKYASLHCHTDNSDGYNTVKDNVAQAKRMGLDGLGITDHGTMAGVFDHWEDAREAGIKPVIGTEIYLRLPKSWHRPTRNSASGRFHMTILTTNWDGYRNLVKINNAGHKNIEKTNKKFPIVTLDILEEYAGNGLVILTGCVASPTFHDDIDVAEEYINFLTKTFGKDNIFAELMAVEIERYDFSRLNGYERPLHLANKFGLKTVWTDDVHAARHDDLEMLQAYTLAKSGYEFTAGSIQSKEDSFHDAIRTIGADEAVKAFSGVNEIVERVEEINFYREYSLPQADKEIEEMYAEIDKQIEIDIAFFLENETYTPDGVLMTEKLLRERIKEEKDLILKYKFSGYFAVLWDILRIGYEKNVLNVARGSASGSYILYLLGVTQVNPIEYGLMFERFLAELRLTTGELPDVDVDISSNDRHIIQEYAKERWGFEPVGTVNRYNHASLVRLISRIYSLKTDEELNAKLVGDASSLRDSTLGTGDEDDVSTDNSAEDIAQYSASFKQLMSVGDWTYKLYNDLSGARQNFGAHACAVTPVDDDMPVPIEAWGSHPVVIFSESGSKKTLQSIGYVKYDFLSLDTLEKQRRLIELTGVKAPKVIKDNDPCFAIFNDEALTGIFQSDTKPSRRVHKLMAKNGRKINSIMQLAILQALIRPGAFQFINEYVERTIDTSVHPEFIRSIFDRTDGVLIFQEQVAELFARISAPIYNKEAKEYGIVALKNLVPKNQKVAQTDKFKAGYEKLHKMFIEGGVTHHGLDVLYLEELFASLVGFIRYGFNLSHAISYANLSAQAAWYKYNYPNEFWTVVLSGVDNSKDERNKLLRYIVDAVTDSGLQFKAPHINTGGREYTIENGYIQAPLDMVQGLGNVGVERVLQNRPYVSMSDVKERSGLPKTLRRKMYEAGMFSGLDGDVYDLGLFEHKSYDLRDKNGKWADAQTGVVTGILSHGIEIDGEDVYNINATLSDEENSFLNSKKIKQNSPVNTPVIGYKILFFALENNIISWKRLEYTEPTTKLLYPWESDADRAKATKSLIGFSLPSNLLKLVEYADSKVDKIVGYIVAIEEKPSKKKSFMQLYFTLQDGQRSYVCTEDYTPRQFIKSKSQVDVDLARQFQVGDLVGITLVMSVDKEGNQMSYGQIKEIKLLG